MLSFDEASISWIIWECGDDDIKMILHLDVYFSRVARGLCIEWPVNEKAKVIFGGPSASLNVILLSSFRFVCDMHLFRCFTRCVSVWVCVCVSSLFCYLACKEALSRNLTNHCWSTCSILQCFITLLSSAIYCSPSRHDHLRKGKFYAQVRVQLEAA